MNNYFKIFILALLFSGGVYLGFVLWLWEFIIDFKTYVLPFMPTELLFIFSLLGFWILFTLYKNMIK
jgi:hypothetical protein